MSLLVLPDRGSLGRAWRKRHFTARGKDFVHQPAAGPKSRPRQDRDPRISQIQRPLSTFDNLVRRTLRSLAESLDGDHAPDGSLAAIVFGRPFRRSRPNPIRDAAHVILVGPLRSNL